MDSYQKYKRDFLDELRADSAINGSDTEDEFLSRTLGMLEDYDEIQDSQKLGVGDKRCSGQRIMRVDGYSFDETDHSIDLFISDFQDTYDTDNLTMSRVDELYWRMYYFLDEVCNGNIGDYFDDSDDILKVAKLIKYRVNAINDDPQQILKIKMFILTNKDLSTDLLDRNLLETKIKKTKGASKVVKSNKKIKKTDFNGKPLEINLWHLERFFEKEKSFSSDPIVIDFVNNFDSEGLPCIKGNIGDNLGYEAYIAIIPGKTLASIYIEHGSKVLEGNVRAFLGTSGSKSVNSGIRRTINNEPDKFFTYNNGIATTAADVETEEKDGQLYITKIVDLQIINGGQTTASLAEAVLKKTNTDLSGIFVPMKLTVIDDRETENDEGVRFYDEMVQNIAKYANSQNKVTAADLFSNDPFHIWMEKTSKKVLAPAVKFSVPTGWYYERSRKRYLQEQFKLVGANDKKRFAARFPKSQVITKEQLGMYLTAISQKPHIVAKGKNFVIKEFNTLVSQSYKSDKSVFNEFYFKKCVCSAIIYRTVDEYLETNKDSVKKHTGFWYKAGGYKLDIVPYTIAKIISCIPGGFTLNWDLIWNRQGLSAAFMHEIEIVTKMTNDFICDSNGVIVTEYCKRLDTWERYRDKVNYHLSEKFINELMPESLMKEQETSVKREEKDKSDLKYVMEIINLGADYWKRLLEEAKIHSALGYTDQTWLLQAISFAEKGQIPCSAAGKVPAKTMTMAKTIFEIKDKLESLGIKV
ncbi:MAG: AIPR family protein [Clostridia bacterium]|nr:AIPR family protein [Clostridia bacterium]